MTFYLWFIDLMNITGLINLNVETSRIKNELTWLFYERPYEEIEFRYYLKQEAIHSGGAQ